MEHGARLWLDRSRYRSRMPCWSSFRLLRDADVFGGRLSASDVVAMAIPGHEKLGFRVSGTCLNTGPKIYDDNSLNPLMDSTQAQKVVVELYEALRKVLHGRCWIIDHKHRPLDKTAAIK